MKLDFSKQEIWDAWNEIVAAVAALSGIGEFGSHNDSLTIIKKVLEKTLEGDENGKTIH